MNNTRQNRPGTAPAAKDQPPARQPDAGQVFSTFVRHLEQLGKASRSRSARPKGRSA